MRKLYYVFILIGFSFSYACSEGESNPILVDEDKQEQDTVMQSIDPLQGYSSDDKILENSHSRPPMEHRWKLVEVLTDEFNGDKLDPLKWDDFHPHWSGRAPSKFKKGNAYVADGNLKLKSGVMKDPATVDDPENDIWVDAAACVSKGWTAKPGYYYEASMKASSLSMSSSFWFRVGKYSEIDVIEHIGQASNPISQTRNKDLAFQYHTNAFHYSGGKTLAVVRNEWTMPTKGRDEYHTYGLWWKDPKTLHFYHNGERVMTTVPPTPFEENLKMIFDTEVFTFFTASWGKTGLPLVKNLNDNTKNTANIDFVRTYQVSDETFDAGILKNGSFERGGITGWLWKGDVKLNNHTLNLNEGVMNLQLTNGGSVIQEVAVEKNTDYQLTWNASVSAGVMKVEIVDIKTETSITNEWFEQSFDFNTGDQEKVYVRLTIDADATGYVDAISLFQDKN